MEIRNGIAVLCYGFLDFSIRFVLAWLRSEQIKNDMLLQFEFSIVVKTLNLELEQIVDEL